MPFCVKCGQDNPGSTKYCQKCGAMLPQMAPTGMPGAESSLDLDENTQYLTPQYRYFSEIMHHLSWSAHDFLEEGMPIEPFLESFDEVRQNFHRFQAHDLPVLLESLAAQRADLPDDQYPRQLSYLNTKGVNLYEEGISKVESFLASLDHDEANPDLLIEGITRILDGNDHFCLCVELVQARLVAIDEYLKKGRAEGIGSQDEGGSEEPAAAAQQPEPVASSSDDEGLA